MYSIKEMPATKPDTTGYMKPKEDADVVVCMAPGSATVTRPASWGPGADLEVQEGMPHIAQDASGDTYPNAEFSRFYLLAGAVSPEKDTRAAYLKGFWAAHGKSASSYLAKKILPALVLGEVADSVAGEMFQTTEGPVVLAVGDRIAQSPLDKKYVWVIPARTSKGKYQNNGEIFPGEPDLTGMIASS